MKISNLLFLSIFFLGCNSASMDIPLDKRPAAELSLIKKVNDADSISTLSDNELKKDEAIKKGKAEIINFITDSLNSQIKNWDAVVFKIEVDVLPPNYIQTTVLIPKNRFLNEKMPEFNTIILHGQVDMTNAPIKNSLKEMKSGDTVLVSGSFVEGGVEKIDFSDYNDDFRHPFSTPLFNFNIGSIVKSK